MNQTTDRQAENIVCVDADTLPTSFWWIAILALALIGACLAWLVAIAIDQERSEQRSVQPTLSKAQALEQENRELRGGVVRLAADIRKSPQAVDAATDDDISMPPRHPRRSPLEGKSIIRRAGM